MSVLMKKKITLSDGYVCKESSKTYDYDSALKILSSNKQMEISRVEVYDEKVTIYKKLRICPYCGCETPRYHPFVLNSSDIKEYLDYKNNISFYIKPDEHNWVCSKCSGASNPAAKSKTIIVTLEGKKLKVKMKVKRLFDFIKCGWIDGEINEELFMTAFDSLYEVLLLDFENSSFSLSIMDNKSKANLMVADNKSVDFNEDILIKYINYNLRVKRAIKQALCEVWGEHAFPFSENEITLTLLLKLVQFVNYPSAYFYEALPFERDGIAIYDCLKDRTSILHNYENLPDSFMKTNLPKTPAIKKAIMQNPHLLIYRDELEKLLELFGDDLNLFLSFIKNGHCFEILTFSFLHPSIFDFFKDYSKVKSLKKLHEQLLTIPRQLLTYALHYCTMLPCLRDEEHKVWTNTKKFHFNSVLFLNDTSFFRQYITFSLPMERMDSRIKNCTIRGYDFVALETRADYKEAGEQLDNCLGSWSPFDDPVMVIKKGKKYLAAIEIFNGEAVTQAMLKGNEDIRNEESIYLAFLDFCEKYELMNLKYNP